MATINFNQIEKIDKQRYNLHDEADASYSIFEKNGNKYFQIDTYGSSKRILSNKISQTIQLDQNSVKALVTLLKKEFEID
ncbi:MAG: hypothetical protein IJ034_00145 [Mailhella sp.]|nr:hypothetical protein [Mailhella sp.]MBQ8744244.1 hypothetical protein [Mailhella sp.]